MNGKVVAYAAGQALCTTGFSVIMMQPNSEAFFEISANWNHSFFNSLPVSQHDKRSINTRMCAKSWQTPAFNCSTSSIVVSTVVTPGRYSKFRYT